MRPEQRPLETVRLHLRPPEVGDAPVVFLLRSLPENLAFVSFGAYGDLERAERFIERVKGDLAHQEVYFWVLCLRQTGEPIGTICLWSFSEEDKVAEIGYELLPAFKKQGHMTEAMEAVLAYAAGDLSLERIRAITHPDHVDSIALLARHEFERIGSLGDVMPEADDDPRMVVYERSFEQV